MRYIALLFTLFMLLHAQNRDFDIYKLEGAERGNTLLVVGGVHGDEPGGYFAPATLIRHYKIKKGAIWVVPNLNFDSILENRRGIYGDMNRKFAHVAKDDSDYNNIVRIKELILNDEIDFIVNLHDGHGFYRDTWESAIFNPKAWGQAYIIDQKSIDDVPFGNLDEITGTISKNLNQELSREHHTFGVKNTKTKFKDEAMQKSLTFFAVTHLKPAIAIETSKNIIELDQKVFYQLKSIEEILKIMDIEYERDFELKLANISNFIYEFGKLRINDSIEFPLESLRTVLRYVPMRRSENSFEFEHPLGAIKEEKGYYQVNIGNIEIAKLYPQYFHLGCEKKSAKFLIDGNEKDVPLGSIVGVKKLFQVLKDDYFRVNIIGFVNKANSQDGFEVKREDLLKRFSMDRDESIYRVEFYSNGSFCGMVGVAFQ